MDGIAAFMSAGGPHFLFLPPLLSYFLFFLHLFEGLRCGEVMEEEEEEEEGGKAIIGRAERDEGYYDILLS